MPSSQQQQLPARFIGESSPLIHVQPPQQQSYNNNNNNNNSNNSRPPSPSIANSGNASEFQTIVNMVKTCMGTGCLVLPFAARQGGLLLHIFGLLLIAAWNVYTVQRLCLCLQYVPTNLDDDENEDNPQNSILIQPTDNSQTKKDSQQQQQQLQRQNHHRRSRHPPEGTAMYGRVVYYALGHYGLIALDLLMLSFLMGILITYINAMRSFFAQTFLSTGKDSLDAILFIFIMAPLSIVPHMGYLAHASALGLLVLTLTFIVIGGYGVLEFHHQQSPLESTTTITTSTRTTFFALTDWLPHNGLWGISHWFGCIAFSFGVAPLTYNFRSSMADPTQMVPATRMALFLVAFTYMAVGIGFWILFPNLESDLLQELPTTGIVPSLIRIAMVVVVLMTAPLLIVPCGELLEGKLQLRRLHVTLSEHTTRIIFRFGICILCVGVSLFVPGFVDVLSFVGCCCVAVVGFCIPPFLHALLCYQSRRQMPINQWSMMIDILMILWGVFATVVSTTYTFRQISIRSPDL